MPGSRSAAYQFYLGRLVDLLQCSMRTSFPILLVLTPRHPCLGRRRALQGIHSAVQRGACEAPGRPRVRRWNAEQALDAVQQTKIHGQGATLMRRCSGCFFARLGCDQGSLKRGILTSNRFDGRAGELLAAKFTGVGWFSQTYLRVYHGPQLLGSRAVVDVYSSLFLLTPSPWKYYHDSNGWWYHIEPNRIRFPQQEFEQNRIWRQKLGIGAFP